LLEWEPRPKAYRVEVSNLEGIDLRSLVPEAFEMFPDGYWRDRFRLIAGSFADRDEARDFEKDLEQRGLKADVGTWSEYQCDLFPSEVYCEVYGFNRGTQWERRMGKTGNFAVPGFPKARQARKWHNIYLDETANYKHSKYGTARAAVSRAFKRLETRGLVEQNKYDYGINLTDSGVETARELLVSGDRNTISVIHNGRVKEVTVSGGDNIISVNQCEKQASERLADTPEPPPPPPPTPEEVAQRKAAAAEYRRNRLVEGLYRDVAQYIIDEGGHFSEADIEQAFAEAMQRVEEKIEQSVNEERGSTSVNHSDEQETDNGCSREPLLTDKEAANGHDQVSSVNQYEEATA